MRLVQVVKRWFSRRPTRTEKQLLQRCFGDAGIATDRRARLLPAARTILSSTGCWAGSVTGRLAYWQTCLLANLPV
jgi:hypothetical protein